MTGSPLKRAAGTAVCCRGPSGVATRTATSLQLDPSGYIYELDSVFGLDGSFEPGEVYADFLQPRMRDGDNGGLVATVAGQSVATQLFEGGEGGVGCLHACLTDLLQDEGEVYFSATFAAGDALVSLLPEQPAVPTWVLATSVGASRSPELVRVEALDDLAAALEVAAGATEQLPHGSSPCVVYTLVHCQEPQQSVTPYSFVDIGWQPEGASPLAESLDLLNCVVALCLERPPPPYSEEHAVVQFLRDADVQRGSLCLVAVGETSEPEQVADMALLLEGIAPKIKASQGLFVPKSPTRSPFQATNGNASVKLRVPNAEYMNFLEQRALSPPSAARGCPPVSPGLFGSFDESSKQTAEGAELLSQMNVSARADSVAALAESHGGNLLKRITEELGKCNEELRSKETAHVELARTKATIEEVRRENIALRKRVHHLVVTQQRRETERWCFHALHVNVEKARAVRLEVQAYKQMLAARWVIRRHGVHSFATWKALMYRSRKLRSFVMRLRSIAASSAFIAWNNLVSSNNQARTRLKKAVQRISKSTLARGFGAWYEVSEENRASRKLLMKAARKMRLRTKHVAFETWFENMLWIQRARETLGRVSARIMNRRTATAFDTWKDSITWIKSARALVLKVANRITQGLAFPAFRTWDDWAKTKRRQTIVVQLAVKRMLKRNQATAFAGWWHAKTELVKQRVTVTRVLTRLLNRLVATSFNAWVTSTQELAHVKLLMTRASNRLIHQATFQTFGQWKLNVNFIRAQRELLGRSASRMLNQRIGGAFSRWEEFTIESSRNNSLLGKLIRRFARAKVAAAFCGWVNAHEKRTQNQQKVKKVLCRLHNQLISGIFTTWVQTWNETSTNRRLMRRCVQRVQRMKMWSAFAGWEAVAQTMHHRRVALERAVLKLIKRVMATAFLGWCVWYYELKRQRDVCTRCIKRLATAHLTNAFDSWREYTVFLANQRLSAEKGIARMKNRLAAAAWGGLVNGVACKKAKRELLKKVAKRIQLVGVGAAFCGWVDLHNEKRHKATILIRAIAKLQLVAAAQALATWIHYAAERLRLKTSGRRSIAKIRNLQLSAAFSRWSIWAKAISAHRQIVARSLARILNRVLHGAFDEWLRTIRHEKKQRAGFARILSRILYQQMQGAFDGWVHFYRTIKQQKVALERCLAKMSHSALAASWNSWDDNVQDKIRQRRMITRAVNMLMNRMLKLPFIRWSEQVALSKRMQHLAHQAMKKFVNRTLMGPFYGWQTSTETRKRLVHAAALCVKRMQGARMLQVISHWSEMARDRSRMRHAARTIINRMKHSSLHKNFASWFYMVQQAVSHRCLLERMILRIGNRLVARCFVTWLFEVNTLVAYRTGIARTLARMNSRLILSAFGAWQHHAAETVRLRHVARKCIAKLSYQALSGAFEVWSETVAATVSAKQTVLMAWHEQMQAKKASASLMHKVIIRLNQMCTAGAFDAWSQWATELKTSRHTVAICLKRMGQRTLDLAFATWLAFTTEVIRTRVVVSKCVSRIMKRMQFASFQAWWMTCIERKRMRVVLSRVVVRMQRLALRIAVDAWRITHRQRAVMKNRAVARTFSNLLLYFQLWRDLVREIEADFELQIDGYWTAVAHPRHLRKCIRYWQTEVQRAQQRKQSAIAVGFAGSLRAAFMRWSSGFYQRKHGLWLLKRAAQRLVCQKAMIVMDKWADYTAERKELRGKADLALRALLMQEVRSAFRAWGDMWHEACAARSALVTQQCRRFLYQTEMKIFNRWAELCATKRRLRYKMELLVGRSATALKIDAFYKWLDTVEARKFLLLRMEKAHRFFQRETLKHIRLTFYTWTFSCMGSRALRYASGRKFDRRVARIRIRLALDKWRELHAQMVDERRNQALMQRSVKKLLHRHVAHVFDCWNRFYEMRQDLRAQIAVKIGRELQGKAASALERWFMLTKHEQAVRLLLERRMARLHGRIRRWVLQQLKDAVADQKRLDKVKRSCAIRFTKMAMKLGFDAWATTHKREMTVRRRAVAKTLSNMLYYFEKWATVCERLHKERELMLQRYELKFRLPTMRKNVLLWRNAVLHTKEVIESAIGLGFATSLRGAMMTWTRGYRQRKHELWLLRRAGQRLKYQKAIIILDRWCDYTAERTELRRTAETVLINLTMQHVRSAFRGWSDFWHERVTTRNALVRQQCKIFMRQAERKSFARWMDLCEDKRRLRYNLEVLMGRCARTLVADMFFTWSDTVYSIKFVKSRMAKAHQYYAREVVKQIRTQFRHWATMTWGAKALVEVSGRKFFRRLGAVKQRNAFDAWIEVHAQDREGRRKELLMKRCMSKICHRRTTVVFHCWVYFYEWRKHLREQLCQRIGRHVKGKVANAFVRWSMMNLHEKEARILLERRQVRLHGRIRRWAFLAWADFVAKHKHLVRLQSQAMTLLTKRAMKLGFDKWATVHKRELIVRRRAAAKTLSNTMYYFDNWSTVCEKLHKERETMLERYFTKFKPQIMRNVLFVWYEEVQIAKDVKESTIALGFASSVRAAYMKWKSGLYQRKHELWLLQRASARLKNQKAMIILDRWCDHTIERKQLRQQANSALIGLRMRGVRSAFRTWATHLHETVAARTATIALHYKRMLHQCEARAFARWYDLCSTRRALRYKIEVLGGRSRRTLMRDVFNQWAVAPDKAATIRGRLLKAQTHFARQLLRFCKACFMEWAAFMTGKVNLRNAALRKSVTRWFAKSLGSHFEQWAGLCARHRRINRALTIARMHAAADLLDLVRVIFTEWLKLSDSSKSLRGMQVATVRRRLAKLAYGNCFKCWAVYSRAKVHAVSNHITTSNVLLLRQSFRQWVDRLEEKRKHFDSVRHHVAQLVERQYRWVWNMWVCEHQAVYRRYHTLVRAVASVNEKHRMRCVLRHWRRGLHRGATTGSRMRKMPTSFLAQTFSAWADWWWQQAWVKRLLDVNTKTCNSRAQSTLALRLWRAQQQLGQHSRKPAAQADEGELARLRAANADLRAEMDGILGFMNSDDAKPKTVNEHSASAMTNLSALSAFNSAADAAASRGVARGQTAQGRAEMIAEKARVVEHLDFIEHQRIQRIARGESPSPPRVSSPEDSGGNSPRAAAGWVMMRSKMPAKKSATGLNMAALREAASRQEALEARGGSDAVSSGSQNFVADASSFSSMLGSFEFSSK